jgi:hypothetical protein
MKADLPGAEMSMVEAAIRERADRIPPNPESGIFDPYPQRLADGLVELAATRSAQSGTPGTQITVFADLEALIEDSETGVAEIQAGPLLAEATARRLSCDALIECAITDHSGTLGIGRRSRLVPAWLRRQLWYRDGGCRFPAVGPDISSMRIIVSIGPMVGPPPWTI